MNAEETDDTGKTTLPGQSGDAAEQGADEGKDAGAARPEEEDADEKDLKGKIAPEVQEKIDRRIGKLTAKYKTAEERAKQAEAELARIREEKERQEDERVKHLGIPASYFTAEERTEVQAAESAEREAAQELARADKAEAGWLRYADSEDGYKDPDSGKTYTPAQCARLAIEAARAAGEAKAKAAAAAARKDAVLKPVRAKFGADLRELQARKANPRPAAGADAVKDAPKIDGKRDGDRDAPPRGGAPARPADARGGTEPPVPPKDAKGAKAFWND